MSTKCIIVHLCVVVTRSRKRHVDSSAHARLDDKTSGLSSFVDHQSRLGNVLRLNVDLRLDAPAQFLLENFAIHVRQSELSFVAGVRFEHLTHNSDENQ